MATFNPPTDDFVVPVDSAELYSRVPTSREKRIGNKLGRHIRPSPRGRNLFLLTTGVYTEKEPYDQSTIDKVYYGGHVTTITEEEVISLTSAGYGEYITA